MSTHLRARAWVEVDGGALRRNLQRMRQAVGPHPALIPMLKADAYGLGVAGAVRALEPAQPWGYGVATAEEGQRLRELEVRRPILVCCPISADSYHVAVQHDLTVSVSDVESLDGLSEAARRLGRPLLFQVEIDTGMGRSGLDWRDAATWGMEIAGRTRHDIRWTGCFMQFHSAQLRQRQQSETQWERFQDALAALPVAREGLMVHAANSAAALRFPEFAGDAVRPGIFLYGGSAAPDLPAPEPVVSVRARVLRVRDVPAGTTVGYGATHQARGWERWATLAIGYGDGLPCALASSGSVLLGGRRVPMLGRISMDVTVVDITGDEGIHCGDVATLVGRQGEHEITVDELASRAGTNNYEILTRWTERLPRIWTNDEMA